ncbi:MAG: ferritin family protein [Clostridiales bacterium]|nr:ferritin family protein [Clostridiales bacterium]
MAWSLTHYTAEEIVDLAVTIEKEGKEFYDSALAYAKGYKLKEALVFLAREEEKHIAVFRKIGDKLVSTFTPNESYEGEYEEYLRSIVNSRSFNVNKAADMVKTLHTDKDILNFALTFEKDSILIFEEFKAFVNDEGKDIIKELIEEEKGHIRKIVKVFRELED